MRTIITIEARMGSTRLPGKVLLPLAGKPVLQHVIERLKRVSKADDVVVATTENPLDDAIVELCEKLHCSVFRGSEEDVLGRVLAAAENFEAEVIVQTTADCPLIDPEVVEYAIELFQLSDVDYVSNRLERSYPTGVDPQVFSRKALEKADRQTTCLNDREHGSSYIYTHPEEYSMKNFKRSGENLAYHRWLLDYPEDYDFMKEVFEALYPKNPEFSMEDVLKFLEERPEVSSINAMHGVSTTVYPYSETLPYTEDQ